MQVGIGCAHCRGHDGYEYECCEYGAQRSEQLMEVIFQNNDENLVKRARREADGWIGYVEFMGVPTRRCALSAHPLNR